MKEGFRQSMAWLHTWTGLVFGWLLFAIFLTGTLAYFKAEISHWMQPEIPVHAIDSANSLSLAQGYLQQHAPAASRWLIDLPNARDPALTVRWQNTPVEAGKRGGFTQKHSMRRPVQKYRPGTAGAASSSTASISSCKCLIRGAAGWRRRPRW
jgi:uncharacterized iron-regulated membrane protein